VVEIIGERYLSKRNPIVEVFCTSCVQTFPGGMKNDVCVTFFLVVDRERAASKDPTSTFFLLLEPKLKLQPTTTQQPNLPTRERNNNNNNNNQNLTIYLSGYNFLEFNSFVFVVGILTRVIFNSTPTYSDILFYNEILSFFQFRHHFSERFFIGTIKYHKLFDSKLLLPLVLTSRSIQEILDEKRMSSILLWFYQLVITVVVVLITIPISYLFIFVFTIPLL
jgi:hypothetical protein